MILSLTDGLALAASGLLAGVVNAIAGGGTFFTFATLMAVGLPPVAANATSAVSLVPSSIAATLAYRKEIVALRRLLIPLGIVSGLCGLAGGWLLLHTDNTTFRGLIPWLLLFATLLFAASPLIPGLMRRLRRQAGVVAPEPKATAGAIALQGVVAVYGGYFGAGMGIMMLASLSLIFGPRFHEANAAKNLLSVLMQGFAVVLFLFTGLVHWPSAIVVTIAGIVGGVVGVRVGRHVPTLVIRWIVVAIGAALTVYYFLR